MKKENGNPIFRAFDSTRVVCVCILLEFEKRSGEKFDRIVPSFSKVYDRERKHECNCRVDRECIFRATLVIRIRASEITLVTFSSHFITVIKES